ncbi:hypothetical protein BRARA_E03222 [Brassica rapa]|uniref:CRAL-TRIO domain-containing protein n=1 Tax=Brassica campestris TaxID=3711 RepID=A0A397ZMJ1_BRACM|nr:hypothetical protein BRARA_E03222 [Brassica rapa]
METTQLLLDSQSKLEQTLVLLQEKHLHQFLELFLCYQLGKDNESAESRRLSNILLKRSLDGVKKDDVVKQWRLLEDDVDLQSLIVESLVNMNQQSSLPHLKQSTLVTLFSERKCLVELITLVRAHLEGNGELDKEMWGICLLEEEKSQAILLKFLRATDCSVSKSLNMFKNALKWRTDEKINELCQHSVVDHAPSIFMYGLDRKGHPVVYDNIYHDFAKNIFDTRGQLDHTVAGFIKSRDMFMEMTLRKLGGDSSFLYIFNVLNEHGLTKQDLNLVTELTKEKLKLSQKRYPNFAATQLFINCSLMEYLQYQMSRIHRSPRSKSEVVMAQTSKSLKTLIKYVRPNEIPIKFGGLSVEAEDIYQSWKEEDTKTFSVFVFQKCEILLTFRSTRNCLVYNSAFIPGTFRTVVGQTSFTQASDKLEFTDIAGLEIEGDLRRHSFKVTEPGKLVVAGDNPTSSKAMLLYSYRVNYNVN